jgi:hypothetical protein
MLCLLESSRYPIYFIKFSVTDCLSLDKGPFNGRPLYQLASKQHWYQNIAIVLDYQSQLPRQGEHQMPYFTSNISERRSRHQLSVRATPQLAHSMDLQLWGTTFTVDPLGRRNRWTPNVIVLHNSTLRIFTKTAERTLPPCQAMYRRQLL